MRVAAPPEGGRANEAALRTLAAALCLPRINLQLVAGHGARDKVVEVVGLGADETERRLEQAGEGDDRP